MASKETVARQRAANRAFIAEVNARTVCAHCGAQPIEWHNPEHVEQNRQDYRISRLVQQPRSIEAIKAEMERCTPLCRRCHMAEDGRLRSFSATTQPGETNGRAKLTEDDVREIRRRHAAGERKAALAREYRVTHRTIHLAIIGETWRHVA
jgi:hypothetical protein